MKNSDPALEKIILCILRLSAPSRIILFGSRASGKQGSESDYDLCCVYKSLDQSSLGVAGSLSEGLIRNKIYDPVDVVATTETTLQSDSPIFSEIRKGVVVYERS